MPPSGPSLAEILDDIESLCKVYYVFYGIRTEFLHTVCMQGSLSESDKLVAQPGASEALKLALHRLDCKVQDYPQSPTSDILSDFSNRFSRHVSTFLEYESPLLTGGTNYGFGKSVVTIVDMIAQLVTNLKSDQENILLRIQEEQLVKNSEYANQIQLLQVDINRYLTKNQDHQHELDSKSAKVSQCQTEIVSLRAEIEKHKEQLGIQQKRCEELETQQTVARESDGQDKSQYQIAIAEMKQKNKALEQQVTERSANETSLQSQCESLLRKLDEAAQESRRLQSDSTKSAAALQDQLSAANSAASFAKLQVQRESEKVDALVAQLMSVDAAGKQREEQITALHSRIAELEALQLTLSSSSSDSSNKLQLVIQDLTMSNQSLKDQLAEQCASMLARSQELSDVSAKLAAANESVRTLTDKLDSATKELSSVQQARSGLESQLRDFTKHLEASRAEVASKLAEVGSFQGKINSLTAELEAKTQSESEAQSTCEDLMDNLSVAKRKVETQSKEIVDLKAAAAASEKLSGEVAARQKEATTQLDVLKSSYSGMKADLEEKNKSIAAKDSQIKTLQASCDELKAKLQKVQETNAHQDVELRSLRERCESLPSLHSRIKELEVGTGDLQDQLDCERLARRSSTGSSRPSSNRPLKPMGDLYRTSSNYDWETDDIMDSAASLPKPSKSTTEDQAALVEKDKVISKVNDDLQTALQHKEQLTAENSILVDKLLEMQSQIAMLSSKSPGDAAPGANNDEDTWDLEPTTPSKPVLSPNLSPNRSTKLTPPNLKGGNSPMKLAPPPLKGPASPLPNMSPMQVSGKGASAMSPTPAGVSTRLRATSNATESTTPTTFLSPKRTQRMDQQFSTEPGSAPVVLIEIGTFLTRIGHWNTNTNSFDVR
jgi:chromosome segregation ATPase